MDNIKFARIEADGRSFVTNTYGEIKIFFYCKPLGYVTIKDNNIDRVVRLIRNG